MEHVERLATEIISGDIHKPQRIGEYVEYVGAPYHIRFGDQYLPRILKIDDGGGRYDLRYPAPLKLVYDITSLADFDNLSINHKQQAKIRVHLDRGSLTQWPIIRDEINNVAREAGWANIRPELVLKPEAAATPQVAGDRKSPEQLVEDYAKRHNASEHHIEIGKSLL